MENLKFKDLCSALCSRGKSRSPILPSIGRQEIGILLAILAVGLGMRVLLALYFPSLHHPDEVYQYLEQGHRLAFGYGVVTWEYRVGARSWLLPGLLGLLMTLSTAMGGGATAYLAVIAATLSAISMLIVWVAWLWARKLADPATALLAALITATWFELVYFAGKPLTEVLASATLFAAAYLLLSDPRSSRSALFVAGFLLGLTFVLRMHLMPAILIIAMVGCIPHSIGGRTWCATGAALIVTFAGALDWATWGNPLQSFWANFQENILHDRASRYGTYGWYAYLGQYVLIWSGFFLPLAVLAMVGARRSPMLLIVPLSIVVSHSVIGHKEYRFVLPALPFILLSATIGTMVFLNKIKRGLSINWSRSLPAAAALFWIVTSAILIVGDRFRPNLTKQADGFFGLAELRDRPGVCGVGLVGVSFIDTGGYTYLHRNVPMYPVRNSEDLSVLWEAFNVALSGVDSPLQFIGYRRGHCYSKYVCTYQRLGECFPHLDRVINEDMRRRND